MKVWKLKQRIGADDHDEDSEPDFSRREQRGLTEVRLWILSDLHVELTRGWDLPSGDARPLFDVLVVAGDLIPRAERGVKWLQERVPDKPIIYIPGNHEAYGTDIDRTVEKAKAAAAGTNIHVLQHDSLRIGNVTFAGATLWTDFDLFGDQHRAMMVAAQRMNDFRKIRINRYHDRFRPGHALARHLQARAFLEAEMRKPRGGPLVVVTHHAPIPSRARRLGPYDPGARLSDEEVLTAAYRSALGLLMWPEPGANGRPQLRPADLWIYGHTHESEDTVIGATRVVSNAKGYGPWLPRQRTWDNPRFNPNFVIET
jgi:predicted phosphodiesterase